MPQTVCRNSLSYQGETGLVAHTADLESATGHADEEAIMQISGAGHWYLDGWISDHAVEFLVNSGSAVTTLSISTSETVKPRWEKFGPQTEDFVVLMDHRSPFWGVRSAW